MTERTIRSMAKELAGVFYEDNRSPAFRQTFPTCKDYMRGLWHVNGDIIINKPGWMYHVELAKKMLVAMMDDKSVSTNIKDRIYDAMIDEHERSTQSKTKVLQRQDRPN